MSEISNFAFKDKLQNNIKEAINSVTMVVVFNEDGRIQYVNEKFEEISNYKKEEMIGKQLLDFFQEDFFSLFSDQENNLQKKSKELRQRKKDGTYYWTESTLVPVKDPIHKTYYVLLQQEITQRKKQEQKLEKLAFIDPLTGLANRNEIEQRISRDAQLLQKELTVLFIDIDYFKAINDNFGHDVGDEVLITISNRLKQSVASDSLIFRYDGEEFLVLLENQTMDTIHDRLKQILENIRKPIIINNNEILLTASIGISCNKTSASKNNPTTFDDLIKQADTAMHYAKRQGRNQFHFYSSDQSRELERSYQIELEVRDALERKEFSMVYQPLINLKTHKIVGAESLLRWNNRLLGNVSPAEFIPILEKTGLIIPAGKWILRTVSQQMKDWQEEGLFLQRVSVNVSPVQFKDSDFVQDLKAILQEVQLDASYLEIEITEGTLLDMENSAKKLHALQELGVKVSIDDFGTGYSSLSYLKQLPIDTLKIDKSFIDDLDRDGKIIVNTIISMGKNLQFRVIAEGIENSDQFKYLQEQKCHEGQGYFFSHPVQSEKIEELYHSLQ
jgi:diguanylate cyclase (GGDEF)-like protein/PAS domain S-box-containing protein